MDENSYSLWVSFSWAQGLNVVSLLLQRKRERICSSLNLFSALPPAHSTGLNTTPIFSSLGSAVAYTQHLLFILYPLPQIQSSTLTWELSSLNPLLPRMPCTCISKLFSACSTVSDQSPHCSPHSFLACFPFATGTAHRISSFSTCCQDCRRCWTSTDLSPCSTHTAGHFPMLCRLLMEVHDAVDSINYHSQ